MNSTMTSLAASEREAERVHVDHGVTKRLGRWTSASQFDVRVRSGVLVLDLRSPEVTGDVEVRLGLHRSTVKLLLAEDDQVDHWELDWSGRGQVKDDQRPAGPGGRRIRPVRARGEQRGPGAPRWHGRPVGHVLPRVCPGPAPGPQERRLPDRGRPHAGSSLAVRLLAAARRARGGSLTAAGPWRGPSVVSEHARNRDRFAAVPGQVHARRGPGRGRGEPQRTGQGPAPGRGQPADRQGGEREVPAAVAGHAHPVRRGPGRRDRPDHPARREDRVPAPTPASTRSCPGCSASRSR